ncbi:MAG: ArnT family glycosyltransferase [Nitrospiraceae bacterium]
MKTGSLTNMVSLLCLAGLLFFLGLGSIGLTDRDEGRNAEAGREMLETGDWISPTFNYEPRYAKPAFLYWLMSVSYRLFGVNEFAARFPSAVFGMALIFLQYLFLARVRGPLIGLLGGLMLLLNLEIISLGRMALTDSPLIFFTTLSLFGFWLGFHGEGRERHWIWLFYIGMGLATLTKGPVGLILPALTVLLYLLFTKRWHEYWQRGFPIGGLLLLLLLAAPWYAAMLSIHGPQYAASAQVNTVGRFFSPMEGHGFTMFFYVPVLFVGFFPWSGLLPVALYQAFKYWHETRGISRTGARTMRTEPQSSVLSPRSLELDFFAALWVVGVLVFFSFSSTRLPHYIGPLFPAAALLTASFWHRGLVEPVTREMRASIHAMMGLGFSLALGLASLPWLYSKFLDKISKEFPAANQLDPSDPYSGPYIAAAVLLAGMGIVGYFGFGETRRAGAFWAAGATIAIVSLIAIQLTLPRLNKYLIAPPQELAYAAGLNLGPGDRLILYGPARPSSVFYARRKAIVIHPGEEENIRPSLSQPGRTMILLPSRLKSQLPLETADYPVILQRHGYMLMASEAMVKIPAGAQLPPAPSVRIPGH